MKIQERYASAVNSSNLKSRESTVMSDTDVLGAYGIADRRLSSGEDHYTKHPLAVPLERLFTGGNSAAGEVIQVLSGLIRAKAPSMRINITQTQAYDMARVSIGWFRHPACRVCGGHGFKIIKNTTTVGDKRCRPCNGTGKVQLEREFRESHRELVRWVMAKVELESTLAGPAAMRALAKTVDLGA